MNDLLEKSARKVATAAASLNPQRPSERDLKAGGGRPGNGGGPLKMIAYLEMQSK